VFDSTFERGKPALMMLDRLVPGWMLALPLMKTGDEWTLYLPPELGYGDRGAGPIPPGSALVFRLQLLGMLSAD
jgi:FKBP-type peptidyl-prolyl cis-trans isomerase FklB